MTERRDGTEPPEDLLLSLNLPASSAALLISIHSIATAGSASSESECIAEAGGSDERAHFTIANAATRRDSASISALESPVSPAATISTLASRYGSPTSPSVTSGEKTAHSGKFAARFRPLSQSSTEGSRSKRLRKAVRASSKAEGPEGLAIDFPFSGALLSVSTLIASKS